MDGADLDWLLATIAHLRDEVCGLVDVDIAWLSCQTRDCKGDLVAMMPGDTVHRGRTLLVCSDCGKPQPFSAATLEPVDWDDLERTMKRIAREAGTTWPPR